MYYQTFGNNREAGTRSWTHNVRPPQKVLAIFRTLGVITAIFHQIK